MEKIVQLWAFDCPVCGKRETLIGLGYFPEQSAPVRPIFGSKDSFPYACGKRSITIHGHELFLVKRGIDREEPLWITRSLLEKAGQIRDSAESLRNEAESRTRNDNACKILYDIADIWEEEATELLRIARFGSGKEKIGAFCGEVAHGFGDCAKYTSCA